MKKIIMGVLILLSLCFAVTSLFDAKDIDGKIIDAKTTLYQDIKDHPSALIIKYPDYVIPLTKENKFLNIPILYEDIRQEARDTYKTEYNVDKKGRVLDVRTKIFYSDYLDSIGHEQKFDENPHAWQKNFKATIKHPTQEAYHGWFWNRSHLIADQLGGPSIAKNAITATRPQNVGGRNNQGGMRVPEQLVVDYLKFKKDEAYKGIYYKVILNYADKYDNIPVSSTVIIQEKGLFAAYEVLNCAYGYKIDYKTGKVTKDDSDYNYKIRY